MQQGCLCSEQCCALFGLLICLIGMGSNTRIDCSCLITLSAHTVNYYFTFGLKLSIFLQANVVPHTAKTSSEVHIIQTTVYVMQNALHLASLSYYFMFPPLQFLCILFILKNCIF